MGAPLAATAKACACRGPIHRAPCHTALPPCAQRLRPARWLASPLQAPPCPALPRPGQIALSARAGEVEVLQVCMRVRVCVSCAAARPLARRSASPRKSLLVPTPSWAGCGLRVGACLPPVLVLRPRLLWLGIALAGTGTRPSLPPLSQPSPPAAPRAPPSTPHLIRPSATPSAPTLTRCWASGASWRA